MVSAKHTPFLVGKQSYPARGPKAMTTRILAILIRGYQRLGGIFLPRACRFYPTCSHYSIAAVEKYGAIRGGIMALFRILRCSPLSRGGYDPVK